MIRPRDRRHLQRTRRSFEGRLKNDDIHARPRAVFDRYAWRHLVAWDLIKKSQHRRDESIAKAKQPPRRRRRKRSP